MSNPPTSASLLFGAVAAEAEVKKSSNGNFRLTLKSLDAVDWFTDRPDRDAGTWKPEKFIKKWTQLFGLVEPNAQVTFSSGAQRKVYAFEMFRPKLDRRTGDISFRTKPIGDKNRDMITGLREGAHKDVSLFIDSSTPSTTMTISVSSKENYPIYSGLMYTLYSLSSDVEFGKPDNITGGAFYGTELDDGQISFIVDSNTKGSFQVPITLLNGVASSDVFLSVLNGNFTGDPSDFNSAVADLTISYSVSGGSSGALPATNDGSQPTPPMPGQYSAIIYWT